MVVLKIPHELKKMNELFKKAGFKAYLVGGAVRDMILGKEAHDWDVATNAEPIQVMKIFHKVIPTGIAHGTVTVHFMKKEIEVTTFRGEGKYTDGRHPDSVYFASTIEEDLSRRDFTMNSIAADLDTGVLTDPFCGEKDISKKIIRTVGNPRERFLEDGLRPVRCIRFGSQLKFCIEKDTYSEIFNIDVQKKIASISKERFRDEFIKILSSDEPSVGLKLLEETGILKIFIPELAECRGVMQKDARGFHKFDVLDHNFYACDGAPKDNLTVRLAALFHDIGKKDTRTVCLENLTDENGKTQEVELVHFYRHELFSEKITGEILFRLKFSNAQIEKVCHLIKNHMFHYESSWSDSAVRKFIVRTGIENIDDLILLNFADKYGSTRTKIVPESPAVKLIFELKDRIKKAEEENNVFSLKQLAVNGRDLIKIGYKPGKILGETLNELFQCVLKDPQMNEKTLLLKVAENILKKRNGEF